MAKKKIVKPKPVKGKSTAADNTFFDPSDALATAGYIIDIYHIPTDRNVKFKGWVTNFSDSYQSNWNTEDAYGRMDPISTFQNTRRSLTIDWDVVASSVNEAKLNMAKCELLFAMLYPTYTSAADNASAIKASPLFKLKYTNLICAPGKGASDDAKSSGLLGSMGGFEYSPDFDAGFFTQGKLVFPQSISLSAEFQVLHNFKVGWDDKTKSFREAKFPYGRPASHEEANRVAGTGLGGTTAGKNSSKSDAKPSTQGSQAQQKKAANAMTSPGAKK
jgi:hypothetical protein